MNTKTLYSLPRRLGLKSQLVVTFIVLISISLLVFGLQYFDVSKRVVSDIVQRNVYEIVKKNNQIMDTKLAQAKDNILSFLVDQELYSALSSMKPEDDYQITLLDKKLSAVMDKYFSHLQDVYSVQLATSYTTFRPTMPPNSGSGKNFIPEGTIQRTGMYQEAIRQAGRIVWIPTYNFSEMFDVPYMTDANIEFRYLFSAVELVNSSYFDGTSYFTSTPDIEKPVLLVNYKEDFFQTIFRGSLPVEGSFFFVVTKDGQYVSHQDPANIGRKAAYPWIQEITEQGSGTAKFDIDGQSAIVSFDTSRVTGWTSVVVIPPDRMLEEFLDTTKTNLAFSLLLLVILSFLISYVVTDRITKPVRSLLKAIKKTGEGQFDITVSERGSMELVVLSQKFKEMNAKIQKLIEENYESKIREKEAEITALNLQLDPHFMYNTLNLINLISAENGQEEISEMIVSLSTMLKYTVKAQKDLVPFKDDWNYLQSYVFIMTKRFEGRFQVEYSMDPALFAYGVPKFFLQPFVENAFVHAFDSMKTGGSLHISGWIDEGTRTRYFRIEDNGRGMEPEKLQQLLGGGTGSVGIPNVNARIKITYGEEYGLQMESLPGQGTTVTLRLPLD
ncbi:sensor histidine kinase [Paenibacillus sp. KR2-11]|nr:sensor histidine kinase [Paenibacillus caseinilyticus]